MLELKHIGVDIKGEKEILKDLSLTVEDGKFVVITGPNGGGKSTLAKVIAGIGQREVFSAMDIELNILQNWILIDGGRMLQQIAARDIEECCRECLELTVDDAPKAAVSLESLSLIHI